MFFGEIVEAQPDPIFGLNEAFLADVRPGKVNLIIGIYKDEELRASLIPSVKKAKERIFDKDLSADYLPIPGSSEFLEQIGPIVFGEKRWKENHAKIFSAQTLGGTGALQLGGQFLAQEVTKTVALSNPTWPNHRSIFERAGCATLNFPYYNRKMHGVDFEAICTALKKMDPKTAVILHPACHNPTGCDLTEGQWKELSKIFFENNLLPFFDFAYQGLGEGIEKDRKAIEIFMDAGHEMLVAYSCSKNFSLYCQRVGALFVIDQNAAVKLRVGSQIKKIIRSLYSNPPAHGARIVTALLQDTALKKDWEIELKGMRERIGNVRNALAKKLPNEFAFLREHKGMFSFIDLDKVKVARMIEEFGIYLTDNGRISLTGLNAKNIDSVVSAILKVL